MSRFNTQTSAEVPVLEPAGDVLDNRNKVTSPSPHRGDLMSYLAPMLANHAKFLIRTESDNDVGSDTTEPGVWILLEVCRHV